MQTVFIATDSKEFQKQLSRERAFGHKEVTISNDVESMDSIEMVTEGDKLVIKKVENTNDDEVYMIHCKEFGLVGKDKGLSAKISVIFCDDGNMLVTLHSGALVVNIDGNPLMPSVGVDDLPAVSSDEIFWVNAEHLLGYSKYLGTKGSFMYDVEFMFVVSGRMAGGLCDFAFSHSAEEDIDLSLGYLAEYEQVQELKREARQAKKMVSSIFENRTQDFDFDDDEVEEDEDDEDDDDDGEDWGY